MFDFMKQIAHLTWYNFLLLGNFVKKMHQLYFSHILFWKPCWTNFQMGKTLRAMEGGKTQYGPMISVLVQLRSAAGGIHKTLCYLITSYVIARGWGKRTLSHFWEEKWPFLVRRARQIFDSIMHLFTQLCSEILGKIQR